MSRLGARRLRTNSVGEGNHSRTFSLPNQKWFLTPFPRLLSLRAQRSNLDSDLKSEAGGSGGGNESLMRVLLLLLYLDSHLLKIQIRKNLSQLHLKCRSSIRIQLYRDIQSKTEL